LLSRADVAHFLLDEVERKQHVGQIVGLARRLSSYRRAREAL